MLAVLERVRQRVVNGDWRNTPFNNVEGLEKAPGCLAQLCFQEDPTSEHSVFNFIMDTEFPRGGIFNWNDNPSRTAQDVIDLLDRVIARQINGQN